MHSAAIGGALCPDHDPRKEPKITDDQCALMISVAPAAPPVSVHQCQLCAHPCHPPVQHFSAHQFHINATYQCPSELPFSASQCSLSVPPISASRCCLSVCISAAYQCPSV
ncbi:unnamed protein product, partial [Staurois parvus]